MYRCGRPRVVSASSRNRAEGETTRGLSCLNTILRTFCAPFYRLLRILGIPRLHSAFCRLWRSIKCAEHMYMYMTFDKYVRQQMPALSVTAVYIHV